MIMLIGQVGRDMMDREAFQEIDYRQMFGPVAKWAAQIDVTARIPEYMARAFHIATSGRPGPVVLALPVDMLTEVTQSGDAVCYQPTQPAAAPQVLAPIRERLDGAKKPIATGLQEKGKSETGKDAGTIAGATAGGALLGRLLSKDDKTKGTLIGAAVGAAAGTGAAAATKGHEVEHAAGTPMVLRLEQPVEVAVRM